jgi:hypothetical protein
MGFVTSYRAHTAGGRITVILNLYEAVKDAKKTLQYSREWVAQSWMPEVARS